MSHESCGPRALRVKRNEVDGVPVAGGAAPAVWIGAPCTLVEVMTPGKDVALAPAVTFIWSDVTDGTVPMLAVVPSDEASDPPPS